MPDHDTASRAASGGEIIDTVLVMPLSRVCIAESSVAASSVRVFPRHVSRVGGREMLQIRRMGPQIGVEITGIDVKAR